MAPPGLLIRAIEPEDAAGLCALANLPGVRRGTLYMPYTSLTSVRTRMERQTNEIDIVALDDDVLVGRSFCWRFQRRLAHSAEVALLVHDDYTGRGIGTALLEAVIDAAFNWHGILRLQLQVLEANERAIRLYERLGFEREGLLRQSTFCDGRYMNSLVMARLRSG